MTKTEFLIGRVGLEFDDDFYPDDLPEDWCFDHYSSLFKALALPVGIDEDLDHIFETIHNDLGDYFELVLIVEEGVLNDATQLKQLLESLQEYQEGFTLWCHVTSQPKPACLKLIESNKVCLQSSEAIKSTLNQTRVLDQNLYYSDTPVLLLSDLTELESISQELLTTMKDLPRVTIICNSTVGDSLDHMQSISALVNSE
jgi:hypothetical protein